MNFLFKYFIVFLFFSNSALSLDENEAIVIDIGNQAIKILKYL